MVNSFHVLGDPVSHSLSPKIHAAAYKVLDLDWTYTAIQVVKGDLVSFLESNTADGYSITMPLKYEAAGIADVRDGLVSLTDVANTLHRTETGLSAYNTDVFGINKALESVLAKTVEVVAILGAGATAKSAMVAIAKAKPNALFDIYVRDLARAEDIVALAGELEVFQSIHLLDEFSNFQDLTVNTLPLDASDALPEHAQKGFLLNANYAGGDSALVSTFDSNRVIAGQTMLVWQALQQIRIFTGVGPNEPLPNESAVVSAMFEAL
jgi:shikimate dehydrogenase